MTSLDAPRRAALRLEYLTIGWNVIESLLCIGVGVVTSGVSILAFGLDSAIEILASVVLVWRLGVATAASCDESREQRARQLVGISFFVLGGYVVWEAISDLISHSAPEETTVGILVAAISAVVMPVLARAKRKLAAQMQMSSLASEAAQTNICAYLSIILLVSLILYRVAGWWWMDAVGALAMFPIIISEGIQSFRGKSCGCH